MYSDSFRATKLKSSRFTGIPRGEDVRGGVQTPIESSDFFLNFVFAQEFCSYSLSPKFLQENLKNPLWLDPLLENSWIHPCKPFQCKILATPMSEFISIGVTMNSWFTLYTAPVQVTPFPLKPVGQTQAKCPSVFTHVAIESQLSVPSSHSSMSTTIMYNRRKLTSRHFIH